MFTKDEQDIFKWVKDTLNDLYWTSFNDEEIEHIAMCCEHIYKWYYEDYPLGGFLTSIVRNDLCEACFRADDINQRALKIYVLFLTWKIPADWRKKSLAKSKSK